MGIAPEAIGATGIQSEGVMERETVRFDKYQVDFYLLLSELIYNCNASFYMDSQQSLEYFGIGVITFYHVPFYKHYLLPTNILPIPHV